MTLPDAYMAALAARGAPLGLDGQEYLKQYVLAAGFGDVAPLRLAEHVAAYKGPPGAPLEPELPLEEPLTGEGDN